MKVNKQSIENWLEGNGFTKWAVCRNGYDTEDQYMDKDGVNLWINWESGAFRFAWLIPHSVFKIVSGDMSPVYRIDHLDKMYTKFLREVRSHG
ncbi:MAG: hypothetical protein ACI4EN_05545 [Butyrivibrio sp.]